MLGPQARIDKGEKPSSAVIRGSTIARGGSGVGSLLLQVSIHPVLFAVASCRVISCRVGITHHRIIHIYVTTQVH
jgi:hypothetical protein